MSNIRKIVQGCEIHPYINNKYIKLLDELDIKKYYNKFINENLKNKNIDAPTSYDEFINRIKQDQSYRNLIVDMYEKNNLKLITDSAYEVFHIVELENEPPKDNYIIEYVSDISRLNIYDMLSNYKDLFGNEIVFR